MSCTRMGGSGYSITQSDIFTIVSNSRYLFENKIKEKKAAVNPPLNTLEYFDQNYLKIHISLEYTQFLLYEAEICAILKKHIEEGTINSFKYINNDAFRKERELIKKLDSFINLLETYKICLEKNLPYPDASELLKLCSIFSDSEIQKLPTLEELPEFIQYVKNFFISTLRFLVCDQFTIYLPYYYDEEKIIMLCKEINKFLCQRNAVPGKFTPAASPVSPFFNIRTEYFNGERLDAVIFDQTNKDDIDKRAQAKQWQESCSLFIELRKRLNLANNKFYLFSPKKNLGTTKSISVSASAAFTL